MTMIVISLNFERLSFGEFLWLVCSLLRPGKILPAAEWPVQSRFWLEWRI
jgi:hypothetical protein